jgi:hypothetical protein
MTLSPWREALSLVPRRLANGTLRGAWHRSKRWQVLVVASVHDLVVPLDVRCARHPRRPSVMGTRRRVISWSLFRKIRLK